MTTGKPSPNGGWEEHRKLVLFQLEEQTRELMRLHQDMDGVHERLTTIRVELGRLGVKAGVWGAVAGSVAVIGAVLVNILGGGG